MSQDKKDVFIEAMTLLADALFDGAQVEEEEEETAPSKKKRAGRKTGPSLNAVRKALRSYKDDWGADEAKLILEPYDVTSLSALDEGDYQGLLDDIEEANNAE